MKKTNILLFLGLALVGCLNDEFEPASPVVQSLPDVAVNADGGSAVTKADLQNVVSIFGNGSKENRGRSQSDKDYTLSTIYDSEGSPAIYVINYADNGGFVLVSATKDYHPILAYAERGNYDVSRFMSSGLDIWEESTINAVKESASLPEKEKAAHNIEWLKYSAKTNAPILRGPGHHEMISDEEYEELTQIYYQSVNDLRNEKCEVYPYGSNWGSILGYEYVGNAENIASGVYWMYEDFWQDFATLVYSEECVEITTPPTVQSTWGQYNKYNSSFPPKKMPMSDFAYAGCGPVAAGQIMRYFKYPTARFDWSDMPLNSPTKETSDFLYNIAQSAGARYEDFGTSTNIGDMRNVFVNWGYSVDGVSVADSNSMCESLKKGSPVYVRGDNTDNMGHAWVASRVHCYSYRLHYDIYNFRGWKKYGNLGGVKLDYSELNYFYFNWGNFGYNDAFFLMTNHDYSANMKTLLNIKPKN